MIDFKHTRKIANYNRKGHNKKSLKASSPTFANRFATFAHAQ